ncbi:MAG: fumarylacetoacetate hydrolase family protein [Gammaproteobacteria bacterium]|nr:fumarylacetoacetate hydrolase family protein [Gammaproteobacteria bacterium]
MVAAEVDAAGEVVAAGRHIPAAEVLWAPATTGLVYGCVLNDPDSLAALGSALEAPPYRQPPQAPVLYIKPWNTHAGHAATINLPAGATTVDVRGTLGIVMADTATRVSAAAALAHVAGYTVVCDLSLPQANLHRPAIREQCFDGACPIGPWVVGRAAVPDPGGLIVRVFVNDELRQERALAGLVRPVDRLIADVTGFMSLAAGEVLLAGVPLRAPRAAVGDRVAVEIPGIGRLECRIASGPA